MRACRYHAARSTTRPVIEEVPVPPLAPGELLVRVDCAGLNPVDWKIATGSFRLLVRGGLPRTMGSDFAGRVAAIGPGVTGWVVDDPVMGFIDPFARVHGTFAEFVPVPAAFVCRRPPTIDERLGAALPCVGVSAVALCDLARVGRGSNVLVNGAAGGVGHLAVQVAKARGARVTAVASAGRREFVTGLGADVFIDYRAAGPGDWPVGFDAVLDCVPNLRRSVHARLLARGGHYASTLPEAGTFLLDPFVNRFGRLSRHALMLSPNAAALQELVGYLEQGRLRCEIAGEFPLQAVMQAIDASRAGHVAGKLVIRVTGPDS
jgi:NADPH:quinone reductase-like Zn-dependent oxidoreductase